MQQPTTTHNIKQYHQQCLDHSYQSKVSTNRCDTKVKLWLDSGIVQSCYPAIASLQPLKHTGVNIIYLALLATCKILKQHRPCVNQIYISLPPESLRGQAEGQAGLRIHSSTKRIKQKKVDSSTEPVILLLLIFV